MTAYIIVRVDVKDHKRYGEYMKHTPRIIHKCGGRFVARGAETVTLEGPRESHRLVLIEFPSAQQAEAFYNSAEYAETKKLRAGAGDAQFVLIDGYPAEVWSAALTESQGICIPKTLSAQERFP